MNWRYKMWQFLNREKWAIWIILLLAYLAFIMSVSCVVEEFVLLKNEIKQGPVATQAADRQNAQDRLDAVLGGMANEVRENKP